MNELQAIEAITKDILAGYYGTRQQQVLKHKSGNTLTINLEKYIMVNY